MFSLCLLGFPLCTPVLKETAPPVWLFMSLCTMACRLPRPMSSFEVLGHLLLLSTLCPPVYHLSVLQYSSQLLPVLLNAAQFPGGAHESNWQLDIQSSLVWYIQYLLCDDAVGIIVAVFVKHFTLNAELEKIYPGWGSRQSCLLSQKERRSIPLCISMCQSQQFCFPDSWFSSQGKDIFLPSCNGHLPKILLNLFYHVCHHF